MICARIKISEGLRLLQVGELSCISGWYYGLGGWIRWCWSAICWALQRIQRRLRGGL